MPAQPWETGLGSYMSLCKCPTQRTREVGIEWAINEFFSSADVIG